MSRYPYPIPSREEILDALRDAKGSQSAKTIARALHVKRGEIEGLTRRLDAMQRDGQLNFTEAGGYTIKNSTRFIVGQVSSHPDGYGFLLPDEGGDDIYLSEKEMQKVMNGDRVQVRVIASDRRGRFEGTIVEVLSRAHTHVVGRLLHENGTWLIAPEDRRIVHDIIVEKPPKNVQAGQFVNAQLVTQPSRYSQPLARVVEVLGDMDDPGIEIEIAVRKFGLPHVFSAEAMQLAESLPDTVQPEDMADRVDLRDVPFVTIDGEDARDFDDAVYCEPVKDGKATVYRLLVAIADVSHYVKPNDAIDRDALLRSTSVYFPRRVIPMLPEKLSNGLCSLNPHVDRLSMVCDMVVSEEGEVTAYQFYPAVIKSAARMTYTAVAAILESPRGPEAAIHADVVPHIRNLFSVYQALFGAREKRGAIDFETVETYIVSNAEGKIEKILPRVRNDAHKLIEECMLAANVSAADLLIRHHHPGTYRIHAAPGKEKLDQIRAFLAPLGLKLTGGMSPQPSDYAELIRQVLPRPDAPLLQTMLLRSMQQAVYSPDNIGHFGLAYKAYAHFTSPIRRYPDLLVHRAIKAILAGKRYEPSGIDRRLLNKNVSNAMRRQMNRDRMEGRATGTPEDSIWHALGLHCSANERRADEASRDVEAWLKCYFIKDKLGEHFTGTISGVMPFGIFVQLDDLYIEGMVHVTDLGADYYHFDEVRHELRGERTGVRYQLTDRVTVQVSRVDLDSRQIDLVVISGPFKTGKDGKTREGTASASQPVLFERFKKRGIARMGEKGNLPPRARAVSAKDDNKPASFSGKPKSGPKKEQTRKRKRQR
ncbi:ribonuclease R [Oxalobacter sp. OttesenSCG-928-P03]|nr:ribonuclease R [Oxalobacter sp. OttesenSCG-928-P03]